MVYVIALAAILMFYLFFILPTQWLKVERVRYSKGLDKKILQISDLHVERLRIRPAQMQMLIEREKPDYIFLTGDFTQKEKYLPRVEKVLRVIVESRVPVYAVLGNHDYRLPRVHRLVETMERLNVKVLRNESIQLDGFRLIGIDDFTTRKDNTRQAFQHTNRDDKKVIITHNADVYFKMEQSFDYMMAGHLHGKQFNVPFFFQIDNKGRMASKGIYKGVHPLEKGMVYISKGIGQAGFNYRFMVRSEVTVHEF